MTGCPRQAKKIEASRAYIDEKFSELKDAMTTKDCIEKLHNTIRDQNEIINIPESKIAVMERYIINVM